MLYQTIKDDRIQALKSGNTKLLEALRLILSELSYVMVDKRVEELSDEQVVAVLTKEQKKRRESINLYLGAGDVTRAEQEKYELEVIEKYLPEMMSEAELRAELVGIATETGLRGGRLMGAVMGKLKGKVDSDMVKKLVESEYNG